MKICVKFLFFAVAFMTLAPMSIGQKPSPTKNDKPNPDSAQEDFSKNTFESLLRERDRQNRPGSLSVR